MNEEESDLASVIEGAEYPQLLNLLVPVIILATSVAYAWSLRDVPNPEMNLLLLRPLFLAIWGFLLVVIIEDVIPSIRMHRAGGSRKPADPLPWRTRFAPGTEAGAGLVVAATFLFTFFGPGDGATVYIISTFVYLAVVGYLIGDRRPVHLVVQAALLTGMLYLVMGVVLDVRL